jgi:hypothetical protein
MANREQRKNREKKKPKADKNPKGAAPGQKGMPMQSPSGKK